VSPGESPSAALTRLVNGYQISHALHAAAVLGIADLLAAGTNSVGELAIATETLADPLYRLLRALAAAGVFLEQPDRRFTLTPMGECLRSDASDPVGPWAMLAGQAYVHRAWEALLHSLRTGETAFRHVYGADVWDYRAGHPQQSAIFDRAMSGISRRVAEAVVNTCDFGRFRCVVDVGGGEGVLLAYILAAHPTVRGVLLDLPHVVARAAPVLDAAGVTGRCDVVAGDFFAAVPESGDACVLKGILHDWDDLAATAILRVCRRAIAPGGALLVIERLIAPANEGADAKFSDLNMLVLPGGRERTRDEFEALFVASGFRLKDVGATGTRMSVLRAEPVEHAGEASPTRSEGYMRTLPTPGTDVAAIADGDSPEVLLFPPLIPLAMLAAGAALQWLEPFDWPTHLAPWQFAAGLVLAFAGQAVVLLGVHALRRHGTNIRPTQPTLAIATDGIFARTRNPIYVGGIAMSAGIALALGLIWALLLHPFGILLLHRGVVLREERYLARKFGDAYRSYQAKVRRYL
jgi:protein-S-isoprenylcysteine O-methyltransferase Ste14